mmetsp:Transcript_28850/g.46686  ORF Transcript_28850/g.46686 Transcript_28850/m.46686 type:complete len:219 (+) Transcript_28850:401-1057(+)
MRIWASKEGARVTCKSAAAMMALSCSSDSPSYPLSRTTSYMHMPSAKPNPPLLPEPAPVAAPPSVPCSKMSAYREPSRGRLALFWVEEKPCRWRPGFPLSAAAFLSATNLRIDTNRSRACAICPAGPEVAEEELEFGDSTGTWRRCISRVTAKYMARSSSAVAAACKAHSCLMSTSARVKSSSGCRTSTHMGDSRTRSTLSDPWAFSYAPLLSFMNSL